MSGEHDHAVLAGSRHRRPLWLAFVLVVVFMVVEAVVGWLAGSLALISDAAHMGTDALGLGMALAAITAAGRTGRSTARTYGLYRAEILAALANALLLFAVAGYVLFEAFRRFGEQPEILGGAMTLAALGGLVVNIIAWRPLRSGADDSLNVEGAYLEVVADLVGSIGVLVAGLVIVITGWTIVDPIVAVGVGVFILPRAWQLGRKALRILIQAAPPHIDLDRLAGELADIPGVVDVHDLHVWTLTSDMENVTAHLVIDPGGDSHGVLDRARHLLQDEYHIAHATLQVEPSDHTGCDELEW